MIAIRAVVLLDYVQSITMWTPYIVQPTPVIKSI